MRTWKVVIECRHSTWRALNERRARVDNRIYIAVEGHRPDDEACARHLPEAENLVDDMIFDRTGIFGRVCAT